MNHFRLKQKNLESLWKIIQMILLDSIWKDLTFNLISTQLIGNLQMMTINLMPTVSKNFNMTEKRSGNVTSLQQNQNTDVKIAKTLETRGKI